MKVTIYRSDGQPIPEPIKSLEVARDCGCVTSFEKWPGGVETSGIVMCPKHSADMVVKSLRGKP